MPVQFAWICFTSHQHACAVMQRQTAVTAYLKSKQLPLFAFKRECSSGDLQFSDLPFSAVSPGGIVRSFGDAGKVKSAELI